ncbi:MAG: DUF2079 domain-containing protein [Solirubrobacteraceae bacterium]
MRLARAAGITLILLQFLGISVWSAVEASRGGLTFDFSLFQQAATLITHGDLNPWSTIDGYRFWQDHTFLLMWPLSLFELIWPKPVTLLFLQNGALTLGELAAFGWMCDIAASSLTGNGRRSVRPEALVGLGAVLLVANPWFAWAESFDFHVEVFGMAAAVATARSLFSGRRRMWVYLGLGLLSGDVGATYELAVGISAMLTGRRGLRAGAIIIGFSLAWILGVHAIGGDQATHVAEIYPGLLGRINMAHRASLVGVAKGLFLHPDAALQTLWFNRLAAWSNLSPSGVVGVLWPPTAMPALLTLAEGQLSPAPDFSLPGFQQVALYGFTAVGTVGVLNWLSRIASTTRVRLLTVISLVLAFNSVIWGALWLGQVPVRWLRVSVAASRTLRQVEREIPSSDEVIAQNGIMEDFASRRYIYRYLAPSYPIDTRHVWFVLAPYEGIEFAGVNAADQDISRIAALPRIRLVTHENGVWAFEWTPPARRREVTISPAATLPVPAWTLSGPAGTSILNGIQQDWYRAGNGQRGYVVDHAYWRVDPGIYRASIRLASSGPVKVELWNATSSTLLARADLPNAQAASLVRLVGQLRHVVPERLFTGWGIWRTRPDPPYGDQLEVRVWSPGGNESVNVYSVSLTKVRHG